VGQEEYFLRRTSVIRAEAFEFPLLALGDVARDSLWRLVKPSKRGRPVSHGIVIVETELAATVMHHLLTADDPLSIQLEVIWEYLTSIFQ
jgi:actin-like ATPase involved in cell morphogenesis